MTRTAILLACLAAIGPAPVGAQIHVAPSGSDQAAGTAAAPFATLARAVESLRNRPIGEPRRIVVHDGTYEDVGLELGPQDSGLTIEAAPGANPRLCGGRRLTGWQADGVFWYAAWPAAAAVDAVDPRLLVVNDRMCPRARFPATNSLPHLSAFDVPWMSTTGGGWKRRPTHAELTTLRYQPGLLPAALEPRNAEITVYHMWDESCVGVSSHDPVAGVLQLAPECGHPPGAFGVRKFVVWNTREGMTQPGQWFHDRAGGRIVYWPLPGERRETARVLVPTRTAILRLSGRPGARVHDVTLRGLTLSVTTVPLVAAGFAAGAFEGAITLRHAEDCHLEELTITRVAGHAVKAADDVVGTRVRNCEIAGCGAGGLYVGGQRAQIRNNHVHDVGLCYPSAVGIHHGGEDCVVSHNEVHGTSYSAINYGGKRNLIEFNVLYDCMKVLHDGAAIYVFGGEGCILRGNVTRGLTDRGGYPVSAYYLDEQCTNCVVEDNLALGVSWPSHNHMATNNLIRRNVFTSEGDLKVTWPRSRGFTFAQNVLVANGRIRLEGVEAVTLWSANVMFSRSGGIERVQLRDYSTVETKDGAPPGTTNADPLFEDLARGDVRFRPGSPALQLGIPQPDFSRAGRETR